MPTKENTECLQRKQIGEKVQKKTLKAKALATDASEKTMATRRVRLRTKSAPPEEGEDAPAPRVRVRLRTKKAPASVVAPRRPRGRPRKVVGAASSSDGRHVVVDRKAAPRQIRVIPVSAETPAKRARGRPKGSLGVKKRDTLLQDELARLAAAVV